MESFLINGQKPLYGQIKVSTAKNAMLPILAGCLLCDGVVELQDVTYFDDIKNMLNILTTLGVRIKKQEQSLVLDCTNVNKYIIPIELTNKLRASVFCLGPLLSRLKKARLAYPGGCLIGARPINIHLECLETLGAKIIDKHGYITANADSMHSSVVHLSFPSVGATENLIMASVFLKGKTTLLGVAKEPEIVDLCNFLNAMGALICGMGSDTIEIQGVQKLHGGTYKPIPDRIIAGTYIMLPLIAGGEVEIANINLKHISPLFYMLKNNSCKLHAKGDKLIVAKKGRLKSFGKVETMPYPFFATDLQQPLSSLACTAKGTTIITENMFENRFKHVPELIKMGAKISVCDSSCIIQGSKELYGAEVEAFDLRGGACLVLAGLGASGYTTIKNIGFVDRGYYKLEQSLKNLGADIQRIKNLQ